MAFPHPLALILVGVLSLSSTTPRRVQVQVQVQVGGKLPFLGLESSETLVICFRPSFFPSPPCEAPRRA